MKKALLLSAYHAASHIRWSRGVMDVFSDWEWTIESLPARFFNWRSRGNSLTWGAGDYPHLDEQYDLILATSMVDLATLRGLRPALAGVPAVVYFHENQFAYPASGTQQGLVEIQLTSIYTALAADRIVFNSLHNQHTFISGTKALLNRLPDAVPNEICQRLLAKASVIPVPLESELFRVQRQHGQQDRRVEVLWNHRWEWDKGPDRLLLAVKELARRGYLGSCFRFNIVGEQFRNQPPQFTELRALLEREDALGKWGFDANLTEYRDLLSRCDLVLSTAIHDFQGLAMLEAAAMGCTPLAPDRLAYPEWFSPESLYPSNIKDELEEALGLVDMMIKRYFPQGATGPRHRTSRYANKHLQHLSWNCLAPSYQDLFDQLL